MFSMAIQRIVKIQLTLAFVCFSFHSLYVSDQYDIYQHPSLHLEFEAPAGWQKIPHPEDELVFEVRSPDSVIHVILWCTETEQSALGYLWKMANMKDLVLEEKPAEI